MVSFISVLHELPQREVRSLLQLHPSRCLSIGYQEILNDKEGLTVTVCTCDENRARLFRDRYRFLFDGHRTF